MTISRPCVHKCARLDRDEEALVLGLSAGAFGLCVKGGHEYHARFGQTHVRLNQSYSALCSLLAGLIALWACGNSTVSKAPTPESSSEPSVASVAPAVSTPDSSSASVGVSASASAGEPLASSSAPPAKSADEPPPAGKRIYTVAAMGDSLTDAKSHGGKYLDYLAEKCPHSRFDNYGKGGQMVNQMRKRFATDILGTDSAEAKPAYTHVIVFGGVNDLCSDKTAKRTVPKIEGDLSQMYKMAHDAKLRVIGITVSPWGGFRKFYNPSRAATTRQLNSWIKSGPKRGEIDYVVDAYKLLSCDDPEQLCEEYIPPFKDGLHFNSTAHKKLGEALYKQVFSDCY